MQFRKVVVGVDFSAASLAAARWVVTHVAPSAEVVLVHVLRTPEAPPPVRAHLPLLLEIMEEVAPSLYGGLRGLADMLDPARVQVDIVAGTPGEALAHAADVAGADLVCVGRSRARRGSARFGASTPSRILARSQVPVLVVPGARTEPPERLLVGVPDAPLAEALVRVACTIAAPWEARVDALHVLSPELAAMVRASHPLGDDDARRDDATDAPRTVLDPATLERLTASWVDAMIAEAGMAPGRASVHVAAGDAGQELIAHAGAHGHDLLVVGRGRECRCAPAHEVPVDCRALGVGSSAALAMWAAPCPVLVIPDPDAMVREAPAALVASRAATG